MSADIVSATCPLPAIVDAMAGNTSSILRFRRRGVPTSVSYDRCWFDVHLLATALSSRGIGTGTRVAIHGATSYEWVLADLACVRTGAVSVALYASAPPQRVLDAAMESRCRLIFTDRADAVPLFRAAGLDVLFLDSEQESPEGTVGVSTLLDKIGDTGRRSAAPRHGPFTIVSTSGTLAEPKLFAVAAASLMFTMDRFAEIYGISGRDRLLLYLPLSHLPQRMMLYWGLGAEMDFVLSDPAHIVADGAHQPTLHVTVPRVLEYLHRRVVNAVQRAGADSPGARADAYRQAFGPAIRSIFVGSAPTDPALMAELLAAGLPVFEVYGTTELGMIGLNTPTHRRPGTVGRPIPWGQVRLDPDTREIQVRTPTPFLYGRLVDGYVEPHQWAPERFEPTADVGEYDDGYLVVRGRLRDFLVLSSGEKVFARPIETAVERECGAGMSQLVKLADGRLGVLLFFADGGDVDEADLVDRLQRVSRSLHPWERPKAYAIIGRMPTVEEGCLTETTKPRRHAIEGVHGRTARWLPLGSRKAAPIGTE
ncbi:long-subunit acyl-CoA synthetase (AMP-forming) [Micromonospora sp. Llam0]|uniref:AMP-binding protein n=1 Tax=Micromonospora sp. Llam0 TaxID=2485143 RepID=UPI000F49D44D|nr:AMP-binding protein [Micromonospora sp. Llam0]ROO50970.1 long-subunit acyl-CoA synthetase (AMP-forming) [Micromonospora sp. Llam0]